MKLAIVLTNDWELFGDGSGDYFEVQHERLAEFLDLSGEYDAKISLFAEVLQQIHHRKYIESESAFLDIVNAWDDIVLRTIREGSDVQLHLHPQWINAKRENGKWSLNMNNTSIGLADSKDATLAISEGKSYLESLIKPIFPEYSCKVFRAGAYCIEPSSGIIPILKENDIIADSSVTKGLVNKDFFDYSNAESNFIPWHTKLTDIKAAGRQSEGVVELPIYSTIGVDSPIIRKFSPKLYYKLKYRANVGNDELQWIAEKERIKEIRYPRANRYYKANEKKHLGYYLKAILGISANQLDYDFLPASAFVKILDELYKKIEKSDYNKHSYIPIIASGHFKDIHNLNNLKKIFKLLNEKMSNRTEFWTISRAVDFILENKLGKTNEL